MQNEIINNAIVRVKETTGITLKWKDKGKLDGLLVFKVEGREITFTVKVKKELRHYQLVGLKQLHQQYENLMIVAENIFPKIKDALRAEGIAYMETNGNLFIKYKGIFYFIDGQKPKGVTKVKTNRAFTKTGLKVIFHFLADKDLVNKTQREIAEITGVALGTIPQVITGLKETGYLLPLNSKEYVWENRKKLLEKWIDKYATELRPKLYLGNYTLKGEWNKLTLNHNLTVWGGEPAADMLTNYLRPEKYILYTGENQLDLIKNYHLIPKQEGEIEIRRMFWKKREGDKTAPPILVYADLMLEGGKRNNETAQKIFNEYIEPNL